MTAKKVTKKKATKKAAPAMPEKTDIPGYSASVPDMADWTLAAKALKVRPFYTGPDSVPFSRLRARLVPDPTKGNAAFNDFWLAQK
jgi:hypothetical protein